MKLIDRLKPGDITYKNFKRKLGVFLHEQNLILFCGIIIQTFLVLILVYRNQSVILDFFIASFIFYLIAAKLVKTHSHHVFLLILVFGFTFRFTVCINALLVNVHGSSAMFSQTYQHEYQVFKDISRFMIGHINKQFLIRVVIFLFEFLLLKVMFKIYENRKHFFIHYFWNLPIIYEFYYRPNLIVIFLFLFFLALYFAIYGRRFFSSIVLAVSFFFNFGIFPFFAFFYKKIKWWLILTLILSISLIFFAGYYKLLFSYMTTFQQIERGFFSLLSFLKIVIPSGQIVILFYYSLIITIVIYLIVKEIYIFDSIYYFLLTLLIINPNKEVGFISFLLSFVIIFPNMGVIYFSLFLFLKIFLAEQFFTGAQLEILNIITVLSLYLYHAKIFFTRLIHFYKSTLKDKANSS